MATKVKGFFKGFKYISQIFAYKEHELEIGYPTDVRHVAHIGWDSSSVNAPSWMNEFRTISDFSSTSLSDLASLKDSPNLPVHWSSEDFHQRKMQFSGGLSSNSSQKDSPQKKPRRKKSKLFSPSSSGSSRSFKSNALCVTNYGMEE